MMDFDRREDAATPLDWVSSADDLDELKMDIFPDQTPDEELGNITQEVVPESDVEENRSRKRSLESRPRASAHRRKKKPAGLPKRPLSAYNIFFQEERLKIQEEGQTKLGFNDFGKIIGFRWKELSDEDRQKYNARAKEDTVRYQNEMDVVKESNKRKKEDPRNDEKNSEKSNSLPCATSFSEATNAAISLEVPHLPPFSQELHRGHPDPQRIHWNYPVSSCHGELARSSRNNEAQPGVSIPPGMEIMLPDASGRERKYTVRYAVYSMRRGEAENFIKCFSDGGRLPERQYQNGYPGPQHEIMTHRQAQAPPQYPPGQCQR